ncbi:MAG: type II toxin-antitoxin system RelE/ParE family toxin [Deltaproteobacteria bacterium]|nr:type II toxin-antitoxin system RelE/ParE family toxin [Deltaproteobacteria bacterium]
MRIFKTKWFVRYARQEHIEDHSLNEAIERAERGIVDANLGGGIIKQRIPRKGQGRSRGYRSLIAYRFGDRAIFVYGFAKNERENIGDDELETLRETAALWLETTVDGLDYAVKEGELHETNYDEEKQRT